MHDSKSAVRRSNVVVVGEALVDVVDGRPVAGGSPANVAVALGRLGESVTLATELGDDENGDLVRRHLRASGVEVLATRARRTSVARARIDPSGSATYEFDVRWDPTFGSIANPDAVHVGSFSAVRGPAVRDLLDRVTATVSYDINARPALLAPDARSSVEQIVRRADLVKASDEDLEWLYPARAVEDTAHALLDLGPAVVFVTLGADGALVVTREGCRSIPALPVDVVDTIGAGDTFSAGLVHALGEEGCLGGRLDADMETLCRAGKFAAFLAAQTAAREGADPPYGVVYARTQGEPPDSGCR